MLSGQNVAALDQSGAKKAGYCGIVSCCLLLALFRALYALYFVMGDNKMEVESEANPRNNKKEMESEVNLHSGGKTVP